MSYNDIMAEIAKKREKELEEAQKEVERQKQEERDRAEEMRELDMQIHDAAVQKQLAKQNETKPSKAIQMLKELLKALEAEEEAEKHGPIDGL